MIVVRSEESRERRRVGPTERDPKDASAANDDAGNWAVVNRVADLLAPPKDKKSATPRKRRTARKPKTPKAEPPPPAAIYMPRTYPAPVYRPTPVRTYERPRKGFD
jgi:hypothetical protein